MPILRILGCAIINCFTASGAYAFLAAAREEGICPGRRHYPSSKSILVQLLEADLVLWTTGSQPSNKADSKMDLPFPCNDKGALKTYDTLQTVGDSHVFALGDLASSAVEGQQLDVLPATAQVWGAN